jgi:hypothetical protein
LGSKSLAASRRACSKRPLRGLGAVGPLGERAAFQLVEDALGRGHVDRDGSLTPGPSPRGRGVRHFVEAVLGEDRLALLGCQLLPTAVAVELGQLRLEGPSVPIDVVVEAVAQ